MTETHASAQSEPLLIRTPRSPAKQALQRFLRHRLAVLGAVLMLSLALVAIFAPYIAPHDPYRVDLKAYGAKPDAKHLLGTDAVGRDVLSRLIYASRVSLLVGVGAVGIYVAIGIIIGAIAGYYGKTIDSVLMRLTDAVLCFPVLLIVIIFVAVTGPSLGNIMLALGLVGWPPVARLVRGQFLVLREAEYVVAARSIGVGDRTIIFRHILPGAIGPVVVNATFGMANAILSEAGLSFLGLGVQPPTASWGNLLTDAQAITILERMPWLWVPPGLAILIAVLTINFIGDGLRDALDPRMRIV